MTTSFAEGSYDQLPNSSYPFTPTLGQEFTSRLSTMASQARANSETYANIAQQSTSSAVTRFRELLDQFSLGEKPAQKVRNNHLSLLAMVDCWWKLGIVPYDHMICSTPVSGFEIQRV